MTKFKGNTKLPATPEWATYSQHRQPQFKIHSKEGLAKSAYTTQIAMRREVQLLKYNTQDNDWDIILDWKFPEFCQCGNTYEENTYGRKRLSYYYDPQDSRAKWEQPVICSKCYNKSSNEQNAAYREAREKRQLAELKAKYEGNQND